MTKRKKPFWELTDDVIEPPRIADIYSSPGHLIRRAQQISSSLFADELGQFGLTPIQYASLLAIRDKPDIDQRALGRTIAIDRSTIGTVIKGLLDKGLVIRRTPPDNLRVKVLRITDEGEALLGSTSVEISRVQRRLLAPLEPQERERFMELLLRLVDLNNNLSRAPLNLSPRRAREKGGR
jgi:MarR family transcriptional regulator, lower aerobic nicotinate degradation pathway regulator